MQICCCCLVTKLCPTFLWPPMDCNLSGSSDPWNYLGKNPVGGCHFLQGIFPTQGSNPPLLHWQGTLYPWSHLYVCWVCKLSHSVMSDFLQPHLGSPKYKLLTFINSIWSSFKVKNVIKTLLKKKNHLFNAAWVMFSRCIWWAENLISLTFLMKTTPDGVCCDFWVTIIIISVKWPWHFNSLALHF